MTEQTTPNRLKDALQGVDPDQAASAERVRRALRGEATVEIERMARLGEALTGSPAEPAEAERLARALSGDAPHAPAQPGEPTAPAPVVEARRVATASTGRRLGRVREVGTVRPLGPRSVSHR
ncbi:hypothetical protein SJ20_05860 [Micrococcus sp. MS-ASIII-49]|uniref:hypothetical protein n=1 Tax=Micrococcus sp. MS-ASIII-49 TaxID=1593237 RepID=UPI0005CBB849|nr:hypothetical protein [Micrococcus sp. MS-ASIII-49]RYD00118.1 hypothetical protein SJ20_05860 [Micrococcus sp. MS-ASIII-49]